MHIYSEKEYDKKMKRNVTIKILEPVNTENYYRKGKVIKNYVFYDQKIKIF